MRSISSFLLIFISLLIIPAKAQDSSLGNWWIYFGNIELKNGFNLHHEIQYRNYNVAGDLEQLLIRTGIGYNLTKNNNNVLLGYGYILGENYVSESEKEAVQEHRIFQQYITSQKFNKIRLLHRYRFEERFIENDFRFRFRYSLSVNYSLSKEAFSDKSFYLSSYNEIFINGDKNAFDRNRLYGALGYKYSSNLRFEAGYMNQFLDTGSSDQINLVVFYDF